MATRRLRDQLIDNADGIKGALILVVAADHNNWLRLAAPEIFKPLTFHVIGFFFLAFSFQHKLPNIRVVADMAARLLVPFWFALTAASIAFSLIYSPASFSNGVLWDWMIAAGNGNAPYVKKASGFLMLWFLPCYFVLSVALTIYNLAVTKVSGAAIFGVMLAAHLLVPLGPQEILLLLPFGTAIVLATFVLGLIWRRFLDVDLPRYWGLLSIFVFIVTYGALAHERINLEIATLDIAGIDRLHVMLLQDVSALSGFASVIWIVQVARSRWLGIIGRHSLLVYLVHPVAYIFLDKSASLFLTGTTDKALFIICGLITTALAVLSALVFSMWVSRSAVLSSWITPKFWDQWPLSIPIPTCRGSRVRETYRE